jgi:CHASE2 domain-containing sensor protein
LLETGKFYLCPMKLFFKALCWFTITFGLAKFFFAVYGLFNTDVMATFIMRGVGAESAAYSGVLSKNLGSTTEPFLWGLLVSSFLLVVSAWLMKAGKRLGFYIYCLTSALLVIFFFYSSFNFFPVTIYMSMLPLLGVMLYISVLENFWFKKTQA